MAPNSSDGNHSLKWCEIRVYRPTLGVPSASFTMHRTPHKVITGVRQSVEITVVQPWLMVVCVNRPGCAQRQQQVWDSRHGLLALQAHFWSQSVCISAAKQAVFGILDAAPAEEVPTGEPHSIIEQCFAPAE